MPDSIKAISPIRDIATAREHATAHMVWHMGDGKAKHSATPKSKSKRQKGEEQHHADGEPSEAGIHHIDIMV